MQYKKELIYPELKWPYNLSEGHYNKLKNMRNPCTF